MKEQLYSYLLMLGDNSMILAHRLSELCGHGPSLETDIALTNISLDLFGQVRNFFQYAAELKGGDCTEDNIAYLRTEREYYNCILVEQANTDFAHVIARQFFFDQFQYLQLKQLEKSSDETIAAIAAKSIKETRYHLRFSSEWMRRLGAGTEESHIKTQAAVDRLYPFVDELFTASAIEKALSDAGIAMDPGTVKAEYEQETKTVLEEASLILPDAAPRFAQGKQGMHTEQLGYILSEFQYMQRAYPNMEW